jgi:pseudaminic acid biosynthesis-associated methylase
MNFKSLDEQELFWKNKFGDNYTERNNDLLLINKIELFKKIFKNINVDNLLEIGCNRGLNLEAINNINKNIGLNGIEINEKAFTMIKNKNICNSIYNKSIFEFENVDNYDLVFTLGVLIHINPERLNEVYTKMYNLSNKYILIGEYYSRNVQELIYRGHQNKLFKRDFCNEIMSLYPTLKLIDYGFIYHRDPKYPLDDITWFLLEK